MNRYWLIRSSLNPLQRYLHEDRLKVWDEEDERRAVILESYLTTKVARGRPRKSEGEDIDSIRAGILGVIKRRLPLKTDQEAINLLKRMEDESEEDTRKLFSAADHSLKASISRGRAIRRRRKVSKK